MQDFLLLFRNVGGDARYSVSPEQMQAAMPKWQHWMGELARQGKFVGTQPLQYDGKTVRVGSVTDGPFAEVKELVVGYVLIKADDEAEAVRFAQSCPILDYPQGSVEVRAIAPFEL